MSLRTPASRARRTGARLAGVFLLASLGLLSVVVTRPAGGEHAAEASSPSALPPVGSAPPARLPDPAPLVAAYAPVSIESLPLRAPLLAPAPPPAPEIVTYGEIHRGQSLATSLREHEIPGGVAHRIARAMRPVFDFRHAQPGHRYRLVRDAEGEIREFVYSVSPEQRFRLSRDGDGFSVSEEAVELEARPARLSGVIEGTLYSTILALGENPELASGFADLFAWDIDFTRNVHDGDRFSLYYERLYRTRMDGEEEYVRPGRILAARYNGAAGEHSVVYYELEDGGGRYFRPDGSSIERQFLRAPLETGRITSRFSSARFHPILKVTRPHHGIDYAAPEGTPLWSVADGTVIYRGWGGGFGNLVKVRHAGGYVSYYAHLSRFREGLRVGQHVAQREVIGYVGHTGLATGPHVCFRIARNGRYVNPLQLQSPAGDPVPPRSWVDFRSQRDRLLAHLDRGALMATEEAL